MPQAPLLVDWKWWCDQLDYDINQYFRLEKYPVGQIKILISLKVNYQTCFMKILEGFFGPVGGTEVVKVVKYIRKLFKA